MNILLQGIVGSTAYGLAGPDSDVDRLGMFAAPTEAFHGLRMPEESHVDTGTGPDITLHEAGKYARLALGSNPTVMELMWLDSYETRTELGADLIGIRSAFLCAKRVRDAYLGYATQQFRKLEAREAGPARPRAPVVRIASVYMHHEQRIHHLGARTDRRKQKPVRNLRPRQGVRRVVPRAAGHATSRDRTGVRLSIPSILATGRATSRSRGRITGVCPPAGPALRQGVELLRDTGRAPGLPGRLRRRRGEVAHGVVEPLA